jgi:acyl transferase domain-containing protein/nucleoside-diphosphate-sugar epimerase/phospholipid N-methyltransferase
LVLAAANRSSTLCLGLTVPSAEAQADLIKATYNKCGLDLRNPDDRPQYFEAHGTGTPAGDPIEAETIQRVFFAESSATNNPKVEDKLLVGSIKTVIGHLEGAAGLAGVLKASLALQHGLVPPNLHFNQLNPRIKPFYDNLLVPTSATPWPALPPGVPRRVSVNSFGFGGTNGHAILESWGPTTSDAMSRPSTIHHPYDTRAEFQSAGPFVLSANSGQALDSAVKGLRDHLQKHPDVSLVDLAYTLSRRSEFSYRVAFSATDTSKLVQKLSESKAAGSSRALTTPDTLPPRILGVFTGQGAQWPTMGCELLATSAIFRKSIDLMQLSLNELPDGPSWTLAEELSAPGKTSRVHEAAISQPLCTAIQVAMVDMLRKSGVFFSAVVGHSSGEIGAAYAAGYLDARDAIRIAYYRGIYAHLAQGPGGERGKMMAVGLSLEQAETFCSSFAAGKICVAASNSPLSCTLAGDGDTIDKAKAYHDELGTFARLLKVNTAYHSQHMLPCSRPYLESLQKCNIAISDGPLNCAWYSSVYGSNGRSRSLAREGALSGQYWVDNMCKPVLFSQALQRAVTEEHCHDLVVEVGPHPSLKGPSSETIRALAGKHLPYTGTLHREVNALESFGDALGFVWKGFLSPKPQLNFDGIRSVFSAQSPPPKLLHDLPAYCWDHDRILWKETRKSKAYRTRSEPRHELLGYPTVLGELDKRQVQWRQIFKLKEMPWVRGHVFQGEVLFPATGFIIMAYEAALRLFGATQPLCMVELHELDFVRAMTLDEESAGTDVAFHIRVAKRFSTYANAEFACYSGPIDADEQELQSSDRLHFTGHAKLIFGEARQDSLPPRLEPQLPMEQLDLNRLYQSYSRRGLDYSGDFLPTAAKRRLNMATVTTECPQTLPSLQIHPGALDAAFHSLLAAFSYPEDGRLWAPYLPTHINRIRINTIDFYNNDIRSQGPTVADCAVMTGDAKVIIGDVDVFCALEGHAQIQISGAALTCFESPVLGRKEWQLYGRHKWVRDAAYGIEPAQRVVLSEERKALGTLIDRSAYFYLRQILKINRVELPSMVWNHQHLVTWVLEHLILSVDAGNHPSLSPEWRDDTEDMLNEWRTMNPDQIDLKIVQAVGENLLSILRGKVPALQVMMQDNMLDRLYTEGLGCREANQDLAVLAKQLGHRYPQMKVLEIGAGTGGATHGVLKALQGRFASYTYSDISPGFFERASNIFNPYPGSNRMIFKTLNIENDPVAQGFDNTSFDLIIASNVLHATKRLDDTMRHCRNLLRPGGHLLLLEITSDYTPAQLTMGTLPGWFLGIDEWDHVLKTTGFSGVDTAETSLFSVMMSQAIDETIMMIREPLTRMLIVDKPIAPSDELLIIGADPIAFKVKELTSGRFGHVITSSSLDDVAVNHIKISSNTSVLVLDLEAPVFKGMNERRFGVLQEVIRNSNVILWVTQGAIDGREPYASMAVGWGRSIKVESPSTRIQFLDLYSIETTDPSVIVTALLRLTIPPQPDGAQTLLAYEPEIHVAADSAIYIPRVSPDEMLNMHYHAGRGVVTRKVSTADENTIVEVLGREDSYELQESSVSLLMQEKVVQVQVLVSLAHGLTTSDGKSTTLCIGRDAKSGDKVIALSPTDASMIAVPETSTFRWLGEQADDCEQLGRLLETVIAESILASVQGRMWVHGASPHLAQAIKTAAARQNNLDVFFTTSDSMATGGDLCFIHPCISKRHLEMVRPAGAQVFINLEQRVDKDLHDAIIESLPPSAKVFSDISVGRSGGFLLPCSEPGLHTLVEQCLEAMRSTPPSTPRLHNKHIRGASISEIDSMAVNSLDPTACIIWPPDARVEVKARRLNHDELFSSNKTYLLIGLTGDLGQSVCEWMVNHGAQHIVVCSRNPRLSQSVLDDLSMKGATVRVISLDISDRDALQATYKDIRATMPPIAGVMNAAMVLRDRLFINTAWPDFATVLAPKVQGSQYLDELFGNDTKLDFFVLFSSLTCIMGNAGQAAYSAANNFMTGLVEQRRRRGLSASVIHIAMMVGLGYVHRASEDIEAGLRHKLMTLAETDLHDMLAEAIVEGSRQKHETSHGEIITGLKQGSASFWRENPRLWHYLVEESDEKARPGASQGHDGQRGKQKTESVDKLLAASTNDVEALDVLVDCFVTMLSSILQMMPDQLDRNTRVADLGIDSLVAVQVRSWFLKEVGVDVPVLKVLGNNSATQLCKDALAQRRHQEHDRGESNATEAALTRKDVNWDEELDILCSEVSRLVPTGMLAQKSMGTNQHDHNAPSGHHVVITGATGFLGSQVLRKLAADNRISKVHCIAVRANSQDKSSRLSIQSDKIREYVGDLTAPMLGLSTADFAMLATTADLIIHLGVDGNIMKTYEELRAANVGSTQQLLGMAAARHVPIHYISASAVGALQVDGNITMLGEVSAANLHPPQNIDSMDFMGLTVTKWVSEVLLERAAVDVPVTVHRCVHLIGEGARDTSFLAALDSYSRELQAVPELRGCLGDGAVQLADVVNVAESIVAAVLDDDINMEKPFRIAFRHYRGERSFKPHLMAEDYHRETGSPMVLLPLDSWLRRAESLGLKKSVAAFMSRAANTGQKLPIGLL